MKNPFHTLHRPVGSESPIEGPAAASAVVPGTEAASEVGEQTEMLTRLRRGNRASRSADASGPLAPAKPQER